MKVGDALCACTLLFLSNVQAFAGESPTLLISHEKIAVGSPYSITVLCDPLEKKNSLSLHTWDGVVDICGSGKNLETYKFIGQYPGIIQVSLFQRGADGVGRVLRQEKIEVTEICPSTALSNLVPVSVGALLASLTFVINGFVSSHLEVWRRRRAVRDLLSSYTARLRDALLSHETSAHWPAFPLGLSNVGADISGALGISRYIEGISLLAALDRDKNSLSDEEATKRLRIAESRLPRMRGLFEPL